MIRVLLADDEAIMRAGLRMLLADEPDIKVVGEAADGHEAVRQAARLQPDVVLMDARMPGLDGIGAARQIGEKHPAVRVLVLTTFDEEVLADRALRAGVGGFLLKVSPPEQLLDALREVAAGPTEGDRVRLPQRPDQPGSVERRDRNPPDVRR